MATPPTKERSYESLFICAPESDQTAVDGFLEKVKSTLTKDKATFKSVQIWGRRRLSFQIKHYNDGIYVYFDFNGGSKSVESLNRMLQISDFSLRHIVVEKAKEVAPVRTGSPSADKGKSAGPEASAKPSQTKKEPPSA